MYLQRKFAPLSVPLADIRKDAVFWGMVTAYVSIDPGTLRGLSGTLAPLTSVAVPVNVGVNVVSMFIETGMASESELAAISTFIDATSLPVTSYDGVDCTVTVIPFGEEALGCA